MKIETISEAQYREERAIVDRAHAYAENVMRQGGEHRVRCYLTKAEASHPDYISATNEMRGRAEQYEIIHHAPENFVAYIGARIGASMDYHVTTFVGTPLGRAFVTSSWRTNSIWTGRGEMFQFEARIGGRTYTGRGLGEGMAIRFRETAASKRKRGAA